MGMNFRSRRNEAPEINLIPFIDVLLVVLIFLMLSTTYSKFTELRINLPVADADRQRTLPQEIIVAVSSDGHYMVDHKAVEGRSVELLTGALTAAAGGAHDRMVVISADANTPHQAVINVLDAARRSGLGQVTFATKAPTAGADADAAASP